MDTKLTLKLDRAVIRRAKSYAAARNQSLSVLVERFFQAITAPEDGGTDPGGTPIVSELAGIIELPTGSREPDQDYQDYLEKRYR